LTAEMGWLGRMLILPDETECETKLFARTTAKRDNSWKD